MGRKLIALSAAIALAIFGSGVIRAQIPQGTAGMRKGPGREGEFHFRGEHSRELSPEDRQRFNRNAERWMQMTAEERRIMRERENLRRDRIQREAETALRDSGLRLDAEKRALFESRYMQERTRIEHSMRQELETKRQQQLPALIDRLKKEFQSQQSSPSATAAPTASPKSNN